MSFLLKEDGGALLQEDGGHILLDPADVETPTTETARPGGTRYDTQTIDRLTRAARLERARRDDEEILACL